MPRCGALDEAAAEHTRLPRWRIIEHAGLPRRDAFFAVDELNFVVTIDPAQPSRLRRAARTDFDEHFETTRDRLIERAVTEPIHLAQDDAPDVQCLTRTHDHL